MNDSERDSARQYVEKWQKAGPALEKIHREELRNFKHAENAAMIDALFEIGARMAEPRTTSGMVEMQQIFMRALK